ncbi:OPT oligopeptide transporter protein-domain-containing protein [Plectosphaerella plurivora]|uniref:OPT oligopeptide transporter protein-domain-containing protein n=1 Tax=Plectosphaerella plurivora TaxID=936078 RepID=A0A9P8V622_9PEZI|nr:OPT oligopeptide transporter protein-domain-containing protein [Plectosphaerella plurivora]
MADSSKKDGDHNVQVVTTAITSMSESNKDSVEEISRKLRATIEETAEAEDLAKELTWEEARKRAETLLHFHVKDPNFNPEAIQRLQAFVDGPTQDTDPDAAATIKTEICLLTYNSPYPEVRAVVKNKDDKSLPAGTLRAWTIGLLFVVILSFINQLFSVRQPSIRLGAAVVQLLSFPLGRAWEKWMPARINPGRFNQKEHMLISIMANVATALPHSRYIVFTTWLERYFNLPFAGSFGFQICLALSMNLMGFGLAGLAKRFLVYPSFCIWPRSLVTVAINQSLHDDENIKISGPLGRTYGASRFKFFVIAFGAMFVWFWFPQHVASALALFNWLAWISPTNFNLTAITGLKKGLGVNPLPTFDWNVVAYYVDPLVVPFYVTLNMFIGASLGGIAIIAMYWTNTYNTGYLPINTNVMFNHNATVYNVSAILDDRGLLDEAKYQSYSHVFIAASSMTYYAVISYAALYHWNDIKLGLGSLLRSLRNKDEMEASELSVDVHHRLMRSYSEVPEWWYLSLNIVAIALGIAAVAGWPTNTGISTVFFGVALALLFTIPTGIIYATTGIEVEYNVLAEFIGGAWQPGNALAMNFFKGFGYVTVAHALEFASDLKLGHYLKIPPRQTFWCQVIATLVSAFVCTAVMNFQITQIDDICEPHQKDKFTCPGVQSYFTAAVLFGSLGARKVWGTGGQYTTMLAAFPVGLLFPVLHFYSTRRLPTNHWLRRLHPVVIFSGGHIWSPYNLAYVWPAVIPGWISWQYIRRRYLAFWGKYNYVLSAAFQTGIATAAVVIFFAVSYHGAYIEWVGNKPEPTGCEAQACTRLKLSEGEDFGPRM